MTNSDPDPNTANPLLADLDLQNLPPLKVLLADHHNMPRMSVSEINRLLETAEEMAGYFLDVSVRFEYSGRILLKDLFKLYFSAEDQRRCERFTIPHDAPDAVDLLAGVLKRSHRDDPDEVLLRMIRDNTRYPTSPKKPFDRDGLFQRAAEDHIRVLKDLFALSLEDGKPLITSPLHAQATAWQALASGLDRADVLITSHPIASAESAITLPVSLRGGFNAGLVAPGPLPLQGVAIFSLYPFFSEDAVFTSLRGKPPNDPVFCAGVYLVHELGHLIRRWGHDWTHPEGCIMLPSTTLDYGAWVEKTLAHGACGIPHPRMKTF